MFNFNHYLISASTIDELLSDNFIKTKSQKKESEFAAIKLAKWCESSTGGDWELFDKRLNRDKLSFNHVLQKFSGAALKSDNFPKWYLDSLWIYKSLTSSKKLKKNNQNYQLLNANKYPFEDILIPLVLDASELLTKKQSKYPKSMIASLQDAILSELCELFSPILYEEFTSFSKQIHSNKNNNNQKIYDLFVQYFFVTFSENLFTKKPVLLRVTATIVRQWIDTSSEFIDRLSNDFNEIKKTFNLRGIKAIKVEGKISDSHNLGRSVKIISLDSNERFLYKPKNLSLDLAWNALINKFNNSSPPFLLKTVNSLTHEEYGWTEFINHNECNNELEFQTYFEKAGGLLCLFHLLVSTDLHEENIIADKCDPIAVDLEMILQPSSPERNLSGKVNAAFNIATEKISNSVLMTGLLPAYGKSPNNIIFDVGGFNNQKRFDKVIKWENINTDSMFFSYERVLKVKYNAPKYKNLDGDLKQHINFLISGFYKYSLFITEILKETPPQKLLKKFEGLPIRKVIRPTRFYYLLLQRLKDIRSMENGAIWSAQADFVARLADWNSKLDPLWPLNRAEREALILLNIPFFLTNSNKIFDLFNNSISINYKSGFLRAINRLNNLTPKEINWQIQVIKIATGQAFLTKKNLLVKKSIHNSKHENIKRVSKNNLLLGADFCADVIKKNVISKPDSAAWIGLDWLGDSDLSQLVPLGPDLYSGSSGIAIFLAAHSKITGNRSSKILCLKAIAGVRAQIKSKTAARWSRALGIGGMSGISSVMYSLLVIGKILNQKELIQDAIKCADLITDELIESDNLLDLVSGSAGAIISLISLYKNIGDVKILSKAIKCGEHILTKPMVEKNGYSCWVGNGVSQNPLNGISHGAAGFALAFYLLSIYTKEEKFSSAAERCLDFEKHFFDKKRYNWPDFRSPNKVSWVCQWCHGSAGIGLARNAMSSYANNEKGLNKTIKEDIQNALKNTLKASRFNELDTLCCGILGNMEFLSSVNSRSPKPELSIEINNIINDIIERIKSNEDLRWNSGNKDFNLGFFKGVAGVGYTLLRQADPKLPNILILE